MHKITVDGTLESEKSMLIGALGCEIELNDPFLDRYCSEQFRDIMLAIPERDRGYILSSVEDITGNWIGHYHDGGDIFLNVPEIEIQLDGCELEDPGEWAIDGGLAYLYTGAGLAVSVNIEELKAAVAEYNK